MDTSKKFLQGLSWIITTFFQVVLGMVFVFILYLLMPGVNVYTRGGWIIALTDIWLGFTIGIFIAGWLYLILRQPVELRLYKRRILYTAIFTLIPLLVALIIGLTIEHGGEGSKFESVVLNNWQPILARVALTAGILGFYLPGWLRYRNPTQP